MLYLLALVGLAYAQKEKQCLANVLSGIPGNVFKASDAISKVNALEADIRACKVQLGNCDGGGEQGGNPSTSGSAQAILVKYGDAQFSFAFTSQTPIGAAFDDIHEQALAYFEMDDDHELTFDFTAAGVSGKVRDDQDLEEAVNFASAMDAVLTITGHKTTLAPTPEPTEPWGSIRYVRQIFGNVADGRDNGLANGRKFKFNKVEASTNMRLHYEENLRVHNHGANCYWEMYIDGKRCPTGYIRGAMHSNGNANNDHQTSTIVGLCGNLAKGEHEWTVSISGNNRDCYTGWDPESKGIYMMEAKEVKNAFYGYYGLTDRGKVRGEDNMFPITGRQLSFKKQQPGTALRLLYADNFRVYGGGSCRWYLRVDDKICENNKWVAQSINTNGGDNDHLNQAFAGYCNGVGAGDHHLKAGVNGNNDCYTGWEGSFHLEVEEVIVNEENRRFMFMRYGNNVDGRDNGFVNWRVLSFKKAAADSIMRLAYSDNLRVHGNGKWCKWELRVDDKACTDNLSGSRYVAGNQNDHTPGMIVGYCKGVAAGSHTLKVHVRGNSADCYTGWDRQSQNHFMMEAVEMDADVVVGVEN